MTGTTAQQAFVLFPNLHGILQDITAELERRLASQGVTILSYGTSPGAAQAELQEGEQQ